MLSLVLSILVYREAVYRQHRYVLAFYMQNIYDEYMLTTITEGKFLSFRLKSFSYWDIDFTGQLASVCD